VAGQTPRRQCEGCGKRFRAPVAAPWSRHCAACRAEPQQTVAAAVVDLPAQTAPAPVGRLEAAALAELAEVGRDAHPLGVLVLQLAHDLDRASGIARQRLSAEFRKAREDALAGAGESGDVIDAIFGEAAG
jgi:hypothetical protein